MAIETMLTEEEAFLVRRVATLLGWKHRKPKLSRKLHKIADDYDAPRVCEGCPNPATGTDEEGVPLCDDCGLNLEQKQTQLPLDGE